MPAGCRGANESGNGSGYSGACAGGTVTHTAQEWGDIARKLDPGYTGHRPRVQLFHGDADTTIRYANFTEAIKEWTNVLALSTSPTSTATGVTLGMHQATRQSWRNSCDVVVLDGFTSMGGDHGPSDALFKAEYVVPFLGLDKIGAVDPEVQQCGSTGSGGIPGSGGLAGAGGNTFAGGSSGRAGSNAGGEGGSGFMAGSGGIGSGEMSSAGGAQGSLTGGSGGGVSSAGATNASTGAGGSAGTGLGGSPSNTGANGGSGTGGMGSSNEGGCAIVGAHSREAIRLDGFAVAIALASLARTRRRSS
jgi:hypothetical protein